VKEELEAIPALLDQFRQSVLAAAFRGDLTADWREKNPDVEPASGLLERIRVERRRRWEEAELEKMKAQGKTPKDDKWKEKYEEPESTFPTDLPKLPQGWVYSRLDFIADVIDPNPKHRNPKYVQDGFSFITTAEFIEPDSINIHTHRSVAEETVVEQENRCRFTEKSIVFSRKGTIGKTRILPTGIRFALLDSLCVVNPLSGIDHNYLNLAFQSPIVCKQIELSTRGVALKQVSVGRVRSLLIPVLVYLSR
jgi:type I restriction enzyme S subunit